MSRMSDMLLTMTSSLSDLSVALKTYIANIKTQLADKDMTIKKLEDEVQTLKTQTPPPTAQEPLTDNTQQLNKLQKDVDEATEMYIQTSEEKDRLQKLLYAEMNKVDQLQMELELAERERDIALRKQSINSDQKQLLAKMEHEGYKINETIERIEHISDMIKEILEEETAEEHDIGALEKA